MPPTLDYDFMPSDTGWTAEVFDCLTTQTVYCTPGFATKKEAEAAAKVFLQTHAPEQETRYAHGN